MLCHPLCECDKCLALLAKAQKDPRAATVSSRNPNGLTALHVAAKAGHADLVTMLLERKADIDAGDFNESTALHLACQRDEVSQTCNENKNHALTSWFSPQSMCGCIKNARCSSG